MPDDMWPDEDRIRTTEVIAALSLATDLGIGVPLEHGLHSTLIAMRLAERLGVDTDTASQTYFGCLLFYVGCTANADLAADVFGDDYALTTYATPSRFGSRSDMIAGFVRAVAPPGGSPLSRARQLIGGLPRLVALFGEHMAAFCDVARMLTGQLGLPAPVGSLFAYVAERWDGKGFPNRVPGEEIPLPVRIVHVARDAAFQLMLGGPDSAVRIVRQRAGHAFDPAVVAVLLDDAPGVFAVDTAASAWEQTLACEPRPFLSLAGSSIDTALDAMGDFSDLVSPYLVGHSSGVAELVDCAARASGFTVEEIVTIRRAALVHDLGRVAVPARIWQRPGPLTQDDWEKVRLHPYHTERLLSRSAFLARLGAVAGGHHERCDGSGYHRGTAGSVLTPIVRLLAAADAYHRRIEARAYRAPLSPEQAAKTLSADAREGRLDPGAVAAVLAAAGQQVPRFERPAGLTERECEVLALLARGLQTKQVAHALGISVKTADRHIQNAYRKIGVSTRAAAALFAMQRGLLAWGEFPIAGGFSTS